MDYKKFIDSVVGNIARKIEDEFNENDHPRDKGGKFASKGGEGKGGTKDPIPETESEKAAKEEIESGKESGSEGADSPDLNKIKEYATDKLKEYGIGDPKFTSKSIIKYRENGKQSISIPMDQYGRVLHITADPKSNSIYIEYLAGGESFTTELEGYGHREMAQALDGALQRIGRRNTREKEYWKRKNEGEEDPKGPSWYE